MSDPSDDDDPTDRLTRSLRLERDPDGLHMRARLLDALHGADEAGLAEAQAAFALLADSGIDPVAVDAPAAADRDVAIVMDRLAAHDRMARSQAGDDDVPTPRSDPVEATTGSVRDWSQEIMRLFKTGIGPAKAQERLAERGINRPIQSVLGVPDDAWFVETAVIELGGQWSDGFHALYEAARRELNPNGPIARRRVSGLNGAEPVDVRTVGAMLRVPYYDMPRLLSRHDLIGSVSAGLGEPKRLARVLVGEGGYGKTTVALAVAQRADDQLIKTLWVPAPDLDALIDGLQQAAILLHATAVQVAAALAAPPPERAVLLWELLDNSKQRWLVVLDDAGPDAVGNAAWLHRSETGTVLVTSRYGSAEEWGPQAEVTAVGTLDDRDGAQLLIDRLGGNGSGEQQDQAQALSRMLAGMPLALTSIGTLMTHQGGTLSDLVQTVAPTEGAPAVETLVRVCLTAVGSRHQRSARALLRLLACFAPDEPLPARVLAEVTHRAWGRVDGLVELRRVGLLEELSLGRHAKPCLRIHPAVAEHSRRDPAYQGAAAAAFDLQAIELLNAELRRLDPGLPRNWFWIRRLEPHVAEVVASPALTTHEERAAALRLATDTAMALQPAGGHLAAKTLLDRAISALGPLPADDPALLDARAARACLARWDPPADLAQVEEELAGILADKERALGVEHLSTLETADELAIVQAERGLLVPALKGFDRVLEARTRLLGATHPDSLMTRHRRAWVHCHAGKERAAISALTEVLDARTTQLGSDHLDTYSTRYRLAWALNRAGKHEVAEREFRELHQALAVTVGPRHPQSLLARGRHASALAGLNRDAEALAIYEELLGIQIEVLGDDHHRTLVTRHAMAVIHLTRGRVFDAVEQFTAVAERRADLLGVDHPLTLESRASRAWALLETGRAATAEREYRALLADRKRALGPRHPSTLLSRHLMCRAMIRRGRLADAERELTSLVNEDMSVLDPDHRNVLHARHSLAHTIGMRGRYGAAEEMLRAVLADRVRVLGERHMETLVTRDVLSWLFGVSGRPVDGLEVGAEVLADRRRQLGDPHPHTLTSRYRQAWLAGLAGQTAEAGLELARLLPDLLDVLGPAHPDTLRCRATMVGVERLRGDLDEAEVHARALIEDQRVAQGASAVDTLRAREELGRVLLSRGRSHEARSVLRELTEMRERVLGDDHPDTRRGRRYLAMAEDEPGR
jgi:tetratricopeptide (TPR) repeat protein